MISIHMYAYIHTYIHMYILCMYPSIHPPLSRSLALCLVDICTYLCVCLGTYKSTRWCAFHRSCPFLTSTPQPPFQTV